LPIPDIEPALLGRLYNKVTHGGQLVSPSSRRVSLLRSI
jgi:hypothetical protein